MTDGLAVRAPRNPREQRLREIFEALLKVEGIGIDDNFMKELSEQLDTGHSALFVLVRKATPDKMLEELSRFEGKVIHTSLTHEEESKLQAALDKVKEAAAE